MLRCAALRYVAPWRCAPAAAPICPTALPSQPQLGGPKVMGANGVSHHIVEDDLAGAACVLRWLSYTPARVGEPPAALPTADPSCRAVDYSPAEGKPSGWGGVGWGWGEWGQSQADGTRPCPAATPPPSPPSLPSCATAGEKLDPRAAIAGLELPGTPGGAAAESWHSGLFDRGSWSEAQAGWARTVVTGRARLGGVPVGVIAVETQTVQVSIAADPGMPDSSERVIPQVGCWAGPGCAAWGDPPA